MIKEKMYQLVGSKSPVSLVLQSRDNPQRRLLHNDAEKKKNRSLRYASNQESPFVDEQDENFICEPIVFEDGVLSVPETNYTLQKFLDLHPDNVKNGGNIFYLWDPKKNAEEKLKMEDLLLDAKVAARDMKPEKMASIIRVFTEKNPEMMDVSELKWEIRQIANNYPKEFLNTLEDPELEVFDLAVRAINDGYVTVRDNGRNIHYNQKENKKRILVVPMDEEPASALNAWFKTEDGFEFFEFLQRQYED